MPKGLWVSTGTRLGLNGRWSVVSGNYRAQRFPSINSTKCKSKFQNISRHWNVYNLISLTPLTCRVRGGAAREGNELPAGRSRVRFPIGSLGFSIDLVLPAALRGGGLTKMSTRATSCGVKAAGA